MARPVTRLLAVALMALAGSRTEAASASESIAELRALAEQGDALAEFNLGQLYLTSRGVPQDSERGLALMRRAAAQGLALAQVRLGHRYQEGHGVERDYGEALRYFRDAAAQRDPMECAANGAREAAEWYRRAAELGHAGACHNLGMLYRQGPGGRAELRDGLRVVPQGSGAGRCLVAGRGRHRVLQGRGVEPDYDAAAQWLRLAAAQGDANGICNLGYLHDRRWGVPQDDGAALRLYRASAAQGHGQCQFNLGVFYRDGRGAPRDLLAAHVWFTLADRAGVPEAATKAQDLRRLLTPAQIEEAERHLAKWDSSIRE